MSVNLMANTNYNFVLRKIHSIDGREVEAKNVNDNKRFVMQKPMSLIVMAPIMRPIIVQIRRHNRLDIDLQLVDHR